MSEFSDCLIQILRERNLNSAQAARLCGVNTTVLYRWLSENSLPGSWKRLEAVLEKLRLTPYELTMLGAAYQKASLGEAKSRCVDEILETLRVLAQKRIEYKMGRDEECAWYLSPFKYFKTASGFCRLNHKTEIVRCVQNELELLLLQQERSLCLKLHFLPEWLIMLLKQFEEKEGDPVDMFVVENSKQGMGRAAEIKLTRMRQVTDLLIAKNPVRVYFCHVPDELGQMELNWLVSDRFLIQFKSDLSEGMMTQDARWISFFQEYSGRLKEKTTQFCTYKKALMDFLDEKEKLMQLQGASIGFMPCLSVGLTEKILSEGIFPWMPDREAVIQGIMGYPQSVSHMPQFDSYFSKEGLYEFMDSGLVDLFSYQVYRPLPIGQRCEVLANIIAIQEKKLGLRYILLKEDFADIQGLCVDQRLSEERLRIYFCFEEIENKELCIFDSDIQEEYARFFRYLKKSNFVYSEEKTLAFMKKVLAEYQEKAGIEGQV